MPPLLISVTIIFALGVGLIVLVWIACAVVPMVNRVAARSFWCPVRGRHVTAEFQEDPWTGGRVEVESCSAFSPPTAVACAKACRHGFKEHHAVTRLR